MDSKRDRAAALTPFHLVPHHCACEVNRITFQQNLLAIWMPRARALSPSYPWRNRNVLSSYI